MASEYRYIMPKCGHPRTWNKQQCESPREYWFQMVLENGDTVIKRKQFTWAGACRFGDAWFVSTKGADILFLIDGRVPQENLDFPPIDSVWNRWQREPFTEDGRHCVTVTVMVGGSREKKLNNVDV
jgi:hypothetical protein